MTRVQGDEKLLENSIKLLALIGLEGMSRKQQIRLMSKAGFQPTEIAEMLHTSANSVNVRLSEIRRDRRKASRSRATK